VFSLAHCDVGTPFDLSDGVWAAVTPIVTFVVSPLLLATGFADGGFEILCVDPYATEGFHEQLTQPARRWWRESRYAKDDIGVLPTGS